MLDFGCGWERLTRLLARDVAPGALYGCDPVESILAVCRDAGVPARLARSEPVRERLPFDLAFAFSVFTHLSPRASDACLRALHRGLAPGGGLVVTVRPPEGVQFCAALRLVLAALAPDPVARLHEARQEFVAHPAESSHPQYAGGAMDYGEAVITLAHVRERWAELFELEAVDLLIADPFQLVLALRRR